MIRAFNNRGQVVEDVSLTLPLGFIMPTALAVADIPTGWLECDGSAVTATYPDLRAFLIAEGSQFGTSGADPLLPDLRGRTPVGRGTNTAVDTIGKSEGVGVASRTPVHAHNVQGHTHTVPAHTHPYDAHQHTSPAHTHTAEAHTHNSAGHGHTISGQTGDSPQASIDVDTGVVGVDRISFDSHAHDSGSFGGDQTTPGQTGSAGADTTGAATSLANGGFTGMSTAGTTGSSSDTVATNGSSSSSSDAIPYVTGRFMIKAVA